MVLVIQYRSRMLPKQAANPGTKTEERKVGFFPSQLKKIVKKKNKKKTSHLFQKQLNKKSQSNRQEGRNSGR